MIPSRPLLLPPLLVVLVLALLLVLVLLVLPLVLVVSERRLDRICVIFGVSINKLVSQCICEGKDGDREEEEE